MKASGSSLIATEMQQRLCLMRLQTAAALQARRTEQQQHTLLLMRSCIWAGAVQLTALPIQAYPATQTVTQRAYYTALHDCSAAAQPSQQLTALLHTVTAVMMSYTLLAQHVMAAMPLCLQLTALQTC